MRITVALLLLSCAPAPHVLSQAVTIPCDDTTARSLGAVPDDGLDDRTALQAATTACAGQMLSLEAGVYQVALVSQYRGAAGLTLASSLRGRAGTVIKFVGDDTNAYDWAGLVVGAAVHEISDLTLDGSGVTGVNEHSPLIRVDGPANVEVTRVTFSYPVLGQRGDCLWSVGYAPDRLINIHFHHNTLRACGRAGFEFHSGTLGEVDHNEFLNGGRAADMDGEGSGGSKLEIHHNHVIVGPDTTSVLGLQVMADDGHDVHDNLIEGKAVNLYGCSHCKWTNNHVRLTMLTTMPVLTLTKDSVQFTSTDSTWERAASAGPGMVVQAIQKISAPSDASFERDMIIQNVNARTPIQTLGVSGMALRSTLIVYTGATPVLAWDAEGISNRVTGLLMDQVSLIGAYTSVLAISGSYGGTGDVTMRNVYAPGAVHGLSCSGVSAGAGVLGPITLTGNVMGTSTCGALLQ